MDGVKVLDKVCIIGACGSVGSYLNDLLLPSTRRMVLIDLLYPKTCDNVYNCDVTQISD